MFQIGGGVTVDGREVGAGARVSYGVSNKNTVYRDVGQDYLIIIYGPNPVGPPSAFTDRRPSPR